MNFASVRVVETQGAVHGGRAFRRHTAGAPVVTQDVDLWFENLGEQKISVRCRKSGAAYVPPGNFNPPMLAGAGAELFDIVLRMDGLGTFADEIKNCVEIPLGRQKTQGAFAERILASKIAATAPRTN